MFQDYLKNRVLELLDKLGIEHSKKDNISMEYPLPKFGDYATNVALVLSKKNPDFIGMSLAEKIATELNKDEKIESAKVAKPGFINITLKRELYREILHTIQKESDEFGSDKNFGKNKKVIVEFVSANPTGPLNVVSARAAAFGHTFVNLLKFLGYNAYSEFYINDYGNQVDILIESVELRYRQIAGEDVVYPEEAYQGKYIKDIARRIYFKYGIRLLNLPKRNRFKELRDNSLKIILDEQVKDLERFNVTFDNWISEQKLRDKGYIEDVLTYLAEKGYTYEKDGAIWFTSSKFGDDKDRVLLKSDGEVTYFVPDIAYHLTKYERGYKILYDLFGPDHQGHVPRLKAAITALGYPAEAIKVIYLQQVNFFSNGKRIKMSKRKGAIYRMSDLIKEVGTDAARFFFLTRRANSHLDFEIELAKKQSTENPVYYVQYAHARICSIIRKAKEILICQNILENFQDKYLERLEEDLEFQIIRELSRFPEILKTAAITTELNILTKYLTDVATLFHSYYQKVPVINPDDIELTLARLYLISSVKIVLANCLRLLGISAPEKM